MGNHTTDASPTSTNHNIHRQHDELDSSSPQSHGPHHHEIIPSSSLLMVVIPIIIVILLFAILLLTVMLRRMQLYRGNTGAITNSVAASSSKSAVNNRHCMFIAHSTINITPNSEGGCLYGSSSVGGTPQRKARPNPIQVFTLKEAEIATDGFSERNLIGNAVYRGVIRDGTAVAIKMLRTHGRYAERAFRLEVDLLSRLSSPYISQLLGYCADQQHRLLIFEYMRNGSLEKHLHHHHSRHSRCGTTPLRWGIRLKIALDCARALEYLHEHNTPSVIHRNFTCGSILLDHNFGAKLSGFGLAKIGSDKLNGLISTRVLGTTGYLAPEYASTGKLTTKSDVYSYGVILLELLTGRVPIDTTRLPGEHVLVSWALPRLTNREKVMEMIDPSLEGQYTNKELIQVAAIAAMCVQTEADYRPLITDVVQSLMPLVKNHSVPCSSRFSRTASPLSLKGV